VLVLNTITSCYFCLHKGAPEKWTLVKAHGTAVGLPTEDDMGNSEVGHNALGAGRIFAQGYDSYKN
jgi:2,3-bisphosphoglycerate-independent phosphoglycerate mutase